MKYIIAQLNKTKLTLELLFPPLSSNDFGKQSNPLFKAGNGRERESLVNGSASLAHTWIFFNYNWKIFRIQNSRGQRNANMQNGEAIGGRKGGEE